MRREPSLTTLAAGLTIFDAEAALDVEGQRAHFRRLVDAGTGVLVGSSGAGEGYTLSADERLTLLRIASEECKGKIRFDVMGRESHTAEEMIEQCVSAQPYGFDVFHLYCVEFGHGKRPTPQELERFFRDVLEAIDVPCYICNQPQMIGYQIPVDVVVSLVRDYPHVVGVQDTGGDPRYLTAIQLAVGNRQLELLTTVGHLLGLLACGGHGAACMEANIAPQLCASLLAHFREGDLEECARDYRMLIQLHEAVAPPGSVPTATRSQHAAKALLNALGLPGGQVRRPRIGLDPEETAFVVERVKHIGLPELAGRF